jgi:predicted Rossmann fold flavoprotein
MTVVVIGGGASGLMAALTAAEGGHRVTLLERQARVGRKLLATGNGRCNLSNLGAAPADYYGAADFTAPALRDLGPSAALSLFRALGLLTVCEADGKVYPFSDQAGSVVDVLRFAAEARGVVLRTGCEVTAVERRGDAFLVRTPEETLRTDRVIACCGGVAGGKLGGTGSGYALLKALGHSCTALCPALVQVKTENTYVRSLKGVRADAHVVLLRGRTVLAESAGEVQFTDYGVSGPAIFEISRAVSVSDGQLTLRLDLLRGLEKAELEAALLARQTAYPALTLENLLTGLLHNRLGRTVLRYAGLELNAPVSGMTEGERRRVTSAVKRFALPVLGTLGFDGAQVTVGGVPTSEFRPETLESRLVPGLYAAGEVLDVDGPCGGYNLQWAWASGRLAGRLL